MIGAVVHADPPFETEKTIDGYGVVQGPPARGRILASSGNEEGSRRHQRMQFVKIAALLPKARVESPRGILLGHSDGFLPRSCRTNRQDEMKDKHGND